jgi:hypothetical protein
MDAKAAAAVKPAFETGRQELRGMTADHRQGIEKFEADLWKIADSLRANSNLASNEYFIHALHGPNTGSCTGRFGRPLRTPDVVPFELEADLVVCQLMIEQEHFCCPRSEILSGFRVLREEVFVNAPRRGCRLLEFLGSLRTARFRVGSTPAAREVGID